MCFLTGNDPRTAEDRIRGRGRSLRIEVGHARGYSRRMGTDIRTMSRGELATAVEWAAREGWNPGLDDAEAFFSADPEGFLLAERDGETVGTISAVKYDGDFGFVGFYIVRPELRGREIGWQLGERALERLSGCSIGIDGVLGKQRQYAKFFGFEFAYRNIRFGGVVEGAEAGKHIVPAGHVAFEEIARYDRCHFPASREAFLRAWLAMPHSRSLACVRGGTLRGYGVIRECLEGWKIGPLFADDPAIAEELFLSLCREAAGRSVFLDVPEVNGMAVAMAQRHGMREVFATARMYRGKIPALPLERIFGVTTFELG